MGKPNLICSLDWCIQLGLSPACGKNIQGSAQCTVMVMQVGRETRSVVSGRKEGVDFPGFDNTRFAPFNVGKKPTPQVVFAVVATKKEKPC